MSRKRQIWYRQESGVAPLAESLKHLYELRPVASNDFKDASEPKESGSIRVFLVDIEKETTESLRQLRNAGPHTRIVGVVGAHASSAKLSTDDSAVFAYVSASAPRRELEKTIGIAFENIELVERARTAHESLEIAERERQQLNEIGRIDVVMVPVDGAWTLNHDDMIGVLQQIKPRIVIPMHIFTQATLDKFLTKMGDLYSVRHATSRTIVLTRSELPASAEVVVLPGG